MPSVIVSPNKIFEGRFTSRPWTLRAHPLTHGKLFDLLD